MTFFRRIEIIFVIMKTHIFITVSSIVGDTYVRCALG